jgi:hypothetical protein
LQRLSLAQFGQRFEELGIYSMVKSKPFKGEMLLNAENAANSLAGMILLYRRQRNDISHYNR